MSQHIIKVGLLLGIVQVDLLILHITNVVLGQQGLVVDDTRRVVREKEFGRVSTGSNQEHVTTGVPWQEFRCIIDLTVNDQPVGLWGVVLGDLCPIVHFSLAVTRLLIVIVVVITNRLVDC